MRFSTLFVMVSASVAACLIVPSLAEASASLGLTGGGFEGSANNHAYALNSRVNTIPPNGVVKSVNPSYQFGGGVSLDYLFDQTGYDLKLDYFNTSNENHDSTVNLGLVGTTLLPSSWIYNYADSAYSKMKTHFNQWVLSSGYEWQLTQDLMIHPSIGLMYMSLGNDQYTSYTGQNLGSAVANTNQSSSFKGWGPSFGADIKKNVFYDKLSAVVNLAYTPVIGSIHSQYTAIISDNSVFPAVVSMKTNTIVMNCQSELGLGYEFNPERYNILGNITLGYRINYLVGATQTENLVDSSAGTNLVNPVQNFNLQGVFVRLVLKTDGVDNQSNMK